MSFPKRQMLVSTLIKTEEKIVYSNLESVHRGGVFASCGVAAGERRFGGV